MQFNCCTFFKKCPKHVLTSCGQWAATALIARRGEKHVDTATWPREPSMCTTERATASLRLKKKTIQPYTNHAPFQSTLPHHALIGTSAWGVYGETWGVRVHLGDIGGGEFGWLPLAPHAQLLLCQLGLHSPIVLLQDNVRGEPSCIWKSFQK